MAPSRSATSSPPVRVVNVNLSVDCVRTIYVTCRGLTTSPIPYGTRTFQIDLDLLDHRLAVLTSDGGVESFPLRPCTVADFHAELMRRLHALGLEVRIWTTPVEIPDPVPFEQDREHGAY